MYTNVIQKNGTGLHGRSASCSVRRTVLLWLSMLLIASYHSARLYNEGIHISKEEYQAFREAAELAAHRNQSLLILPNHQSYIVRRPDYRCSSGFRADALEGSHGYVPGPDQQLTHLKRTCLQVVTWLMYRLGHSLPTCITTSKCT